MAAEHGYFEKTDKELVEHIVSGSQYPPLSGHNAAIAEMQRRQLEAIRNFDRTANRQAAIMIRLTWAIAALTVLLAILAGLTLWKDWP